MKFASMRVQVPVDDAVPVGQVYEHLRSLLEDRGTEALKLPTPPPNGADPELAGAPLPVVGRVHWTAVEVVQAVERVPRPTTKGKAKTARPAA